MGIHVKPLTRNLSHLAVAKNTFRSTCIRVWWKPFSPFQVQYEQRITSYALSFVWIEPPMHINPFPKSKPIRTRNRVQKNIFRIISQSQVQENPGNGASNSNMGGETNARNILTLPIIRLKLFSYVLPYNSHVSVLNPRRAFGADKAHFKGPQPSLVCCLWNYKDTRT